MLYSIYTHRGCDGWMDCNKLSLNIVSKYISQADEGDTTYLELYYVLLLRCLFKLMS